MMQALRISPSLIAAYLVVLPCLSLACDPYIEESATGTTATLRQHASDFERCQMSEVKYQEVVGTWLRTRAAGFPEVSSLYLGRAVNFPWMSRQLADTALQIPGWAGRVAHSDPGQRHRMAAQLLNDPTFLQRLATPFEGTRYAVAGIAFEKVLYGNASEYSSNRDAGKVKVPFDAQLWLRLKLRQANSP